MLTMSSISRLVLVMSLLATATSFTTTQVSYGALPRVTDRGSRLSSLFAAAPPEVSGITLKLAIDRQWGVAERAASTSVRFTSPDSLDMVHRLRRDSDAVLIGRATVEDDNPSLTVRRVPLENDAQQPVRIILDTNLSLNSQEYTIFNDGLPTIVYHVDSLDEKKVKEYATEQTKCVGVKLDSDGTLDLRAIVQDMQAQQQFNHVMVEGGPAVARAFLREGLVDRAILVQALQVEFEDPYPSGMMTETLSENGLDFLGDVPGGDGDVLQCWSRSELPWPTEELQDWP
jgi:riboflavin-specific deaminase-like protein